MRSLVVALALLPLPLPLPALAGPAEVVAARAEARGGTYTFHVTIRHADTGWADYADGWTVLAPDGTELGHRVLHHPHVDEQPFTRALSGVAVPRGVHEVLIRPHDSVHGPGEEFRLPLARR
jgi:hypothetical protein